MKIKAYQVEPEFQESPLMLDMYTGTMDAYSGIIFKDNIETGNRDEDLYKRITSEFDEICYRYENGENASDLMSDYFKNPTGKKWSTKAVHEFKNILEKFCTREYYEGKTEIDLFNLVNKSNYHKRTLRGCCQGDWTEILYDTDSWSDADIEDIEAQYFNMGTEFVIDDVGGYYCTQWSDDGIRAELANMLCCNPEDIEIYKFDGYEKTPIYKAV